MYSCNNFKPNNRYTLRILYISEFYPDLKRGIGVWGGGERQFYEISRRIAEMGHDVTVLTCQFPGQPKDEMCQGIRVLRAGRSRTWTTGEPNRSFLSVFAYLMKTVENGSRLPFEIIHCNTYFPVYAGGILRTLKGIPLISTFHDTYKLQDWIDGQRSVAWGLAGHIVTILATKFRSDRVITISPQCKEKLLSLGVKSKIIRIVENGVELDLFDSLAPKKISNQILYVGRLVSYKHVDWLIAAFSLVLQKVPDATLKIVGFGPELTALRRLSEKLGVASHVVFTGKTHTYSDVVRHFKESELFVLPSTVEGEGIVLKEAMAAGIPFIAMKVQNSGVLNITKNGENGFLVKPGNPSLIAEHIVKLLTNDSLRIAMGKKGRTMVQRYDWNAVATRTLKVYQEVA